jgi:hypothetical protein
MMEVIKDDKLFFYFLHESLNGVILICYISLNGNKIKKWAYLVEIFMHEYKFNMEMTSNGFDLQSVKNEKMSQPKNTL